MIPATNTITQIDELPGEEIVFSIGDPRWVMRTQADLYSNRELAVAREYSTNASDANKEAGVTRPIEVRLPTAFSPYFKVRDFGLGMSRDVLAEVYTKFGESTKRDSNDYNGMLGYGCKSAVAYTTSFTVVSICRGIKTTAIVSRKPDWSIVMKIVSQSQTDEPSGTEVTVPVHNHAEFHQKAMDFYKFWLPGTVLVNGEAPKHHAGKKIIDGLYASPTYGNSYVVMGNVPYRIENPVALFNNSRMRHFHFVAYVNNGDVEFTPSREDLKYTDRTRTALKSIMTDLEASILRVAGKEIQDAKSPSEAFTIWSDWRSSVGFGLFDDLTYKGKKLESVFAIKGYKRSLGTYGRGNDLIVRYDVLEMPNTVVVTEFGIEASAAANRKVKAYVNHMGWTGLNRVIFTASKESEIVSEWIPRDKFVTWADLKAALPKAPRAASTPSTRPSGSWDYHEGLVEYVGRPIPTTGQLFYATTKQFNEKNPIHALNGMGIKDGVVIKVPANRLAKFLRDYPNIENVWSLAKTKIVKDGRSLLSDEAKELLSIHHNVRVNVKRLATSRLDDPRFEKVKNLVAKEDVLLKAYRDNLALAKSLDLPYYVHEYSTTDTGRDFIREDYPLTNIGYGGINPDVYVYMNAKYKMLADRKNEDD